jgi:enoyl-CoA hydratase/carnithine racemase
MPETGIGLFPDVGGGYFLSRCPGRVGEYLALTGQMIGGEDAVQCGLADSVVHSAALAAVWEALPTLAQGDAVSVSQLFATKRVAAYADFTGVIGLNSRQIDSIFALEGVAAIISALQQGTSAWAQDTAALLHQRSPLMLHVVLEQIRRARSMGLADDLRMERDMVRHCFHTHHLGRTGAASETVEGIRALAVDKDHAPKWNPVRIEDVTPDMVMPFFTSPWPSAAHPLRGLV